MKLEQVGKYLYWFFHMPCLFRLLTGLYCPGCGGTRAVRFMLGGQIARSLQYHPLVLYTAVILTLELSGKVLQKITGDSRWYLGHEKLFIYIGAAIIMLNWILKNYYLVVKGIDLLLVAL